MNPRKNLRDQIDTLIPSMMGNAERICIIDAPDHPNVGDQAILLGELDFLKRNFPNSDVFFYDLKNYSELCDRYIENSSILLIHGGGNFGDIWPHHHELRKTILSRFSHKKILQMPQSISFGSESEMRDTAQLIRKQKNFTLLVRDQKALEFGRKNFDCNTVLCPDMAFAMNEIGRFEPSVEVFCLLRTDKEVSADHDLLQQCLGDEGFSYIVDDWLKEPRSAIARMDRRIGRLTRYSPGLAYPARRLALHLRRRYALQRLNAGISFLSRGKFVLTDRLHAHVISCLLDIPNIALDSLDGKVSALYETWTRGRFKCEMASLPADVPGKIRDLNKAVMFS